MQLSVEKVLKNGLQVGIRVILLPPTFYFDRVLGWLLRTVATPSRMELFKTKAKHGFINLKIGGYLAYTSWDTLLLALVGGGLNPPPPPSKSRTINKITHE